MNSRTGLYPTWIAFKTLVLKEVWRFIRIWSQTLIPPAITMSLYFIIFGKFIGSQIKTIEGFAYIQYIVPGLVMMSIMTNSYTNTAASFFLTKFNKSIEELLVSPMPSLIILLGFMCAGSLRGIAVGIIITLIALLFTSIPIHEPFVIMLMAILSSMVFSLGGLLNGIYAKSFDDISFVPTFVLTPLTYLGGVFYSIHQLPSTWRFVSKLNPILNMVDSFRYGFLGISDVDVYMGFVLVSLLFFIMFAWTWYLLDKGIGIKV